MVESTEEAVDPGSDGKEGFGWDVKSLAAYFYADDELLASTWVARLQWYFNTLAELFDRVELRTNVAKMVIMDCRPCRALGGHSVMVYYLSMNGRGDTY